MSTIEYCLRLEALREDAEAAEARLLTMMSSGSPEDVQWAECLYAAAIDRFCRDEF